MSTIRFTAYKAERKDGFVQIAITANPLHRELLELPTLNDMVAHEERIYQKLIAAGESFALCVDCKGRKPRGFDKIFPDYRYGGAS